LGEERLDYESEKNGTLSDQQGVKDKNEERSNDSNIQIDNDRREALSLVL